MILCRIAFQVLVYKSHNKKRAYYTIAYEISTNNGVIANVILVYSLEISKENRTKMDSVSRQDHDL